MKIKNSFLRARLGIHLEKADHTQINAAVKLAHEEKAKTDLARFHESVRKGERLPKKGNNAKLFGALTPADFQYAMHL
jgi:hypothetical protein